MIELNLMNGKSMLIGVRHIQAVITGGSGDGAQIVLGGTLTYDVRQSLEEIKSQMETLEN